MIIMSLRYLHKIFLNKNFLVVKAFASGKRDNNSSKKNFNARNVWSLFSARIYVKNVEVADHERGSKFLQILM